MKRTWFQHGSVPDLFVNSTWSVEVNYMWPSITTFKGKERKKGQKTKMAKQADISFYWPLQKALGRPLTV